MTDVENRGDGGPNLQGIVEVAKKVVSTVIKAAADTGARLPSGVGNPYQQTGTPLEDKLGPNDRELQEYEAEQNIYR